MKLKNSFSEIDREFISTLQEKRLMDKSSLMLRNIAWIQKYEDIFLKDSEDYIAIHGFDHFPGAKGLLNLGQEKDWKWSVFQIDGSYLGFTYNPTNEPQPFIYNF